MALLNDLAILLPGIFPRAVKTRPHKNVYVIVHTSFICNSPLVATTWMDLENLMLRESIPARKDPVWYESIYTKCPGLANPEKHKVYSWLPSSSGGGRGWLEWWGE